MIQNTTVLFAVLTAFAFGTNAMAQQIRTLPQSMPGVQGSVGLGFTDFQVQKPSTTAKIDRGMFFAVSGERAFNVMNLYLTLQFSFLDAQGVANYNYTNLSSSTTYTANDVDFRARMMDLGLGLKLKIIDGYWFRPYVEGGGLGGYHELTYTSKSSVLAAQGSDYKKKDTIMGSGFYYEAGIEVQLSDKFGVKLAARMSEYQTKPLETLAKSRLEFTSETYYVSGLVNF